MFTKEFATEIVVATVVYFALYSVTQTVKSRKQTRRDRKIAEHLNIATEK